jgi:pyridoxal phosphate enzyme (YggS family)
MTTILENVQGVRARIARAAQAARRDPASVTLLAVSKTHPVASIEQAQAAGQNAFGENYVQDAAPKIAVLPQLEWHLIGPLQSNKTRIAAEHFDWIQTVDREKIARRLSDQRPAHRPPLNVLVQINISGEASKRGVLPEEAAALAQALAALPRLRLRGLMAVPGPQGDTAAQFSQMQALYARLKAQFAFDTLSMGMSGDLEAAIAHGATMVRIGTAIFGPRQAESGA